MKHMTPKVTLAKYVNGSPPSAVFVLFRFLLFVAS